MTEDRKNNSDTGVWWIIGGVAVFVASIMALGGVVALAIIGVFCLVTALLDIGMNGGRYARWAPWGLGISFPCLVYLWWVT